MPLIVTDADVLAEVTKVDGLVQSIDGALAALGAKVPAATVAAWKPRFVAWGLWAAQTRSALTGVFSGWFGVPELGNQALAWEAEMHGWQTIVNALGAGQTAPVAPPPTSPIQVADQNAAIPGVTSASGGSLSTGILVGAAALAVVLLMVRR